MKAWLSRGTHPHEPARHAADGRGHRRAAGTHRHDAGPRAGHDPADAPRADPDHLPGGRRRAGVSRTFLYQNPDARALVAEATAREVDHRSRHLADQADQQEACWRERALNDEEALKTAHAEIGTQRGRIGELMGQIRDLEAEWTQEAIQRITTENTTLKQRVRQLTQDNRALEERLKAARSNLRFQDRRIADLEAQLADRLAGA